MANVRGAGEFPRRTREIARRWTWCPSTDSALPTGFKHDVLGTLLLAEYSSKRLMATAEAGPN